MENIPLSVSPALILKAGDIVRLASGGPKMTVSSIGDNTVECIWFELNTTNGTYGELNRQVIKISCITKLNNT